MIIDARVMTITPGIASEWLTHNRKNRKARPTLVSQYARDMAEGAFALSGQPIILNGDGSILDGQHRLMACMEAGVPFDSLVVSGIETAVMHTLDSGAKRTFADYLKIEGVPSANDVAAITRLALFWGEREAGGDKSNAARRRSHSELRAFYLRHEAPLGKAAAIITGTGGVPGLKWKRSVIGAVAANLLANECDHDSVEWFVKASRNGTANPESPAGMLYDRLLRNSLKSGVTLDPWHELALTVKAWNAEATGSRMGILRWRVVGPAREAFPELLNETGERAELIR